MRIKKYKVKNVIINENQIFDNIHKNLFSSFGPVVSKKQNFNKQISFDLSEIFSFFSRLKKLNNIEILSFNNYVEKKNNKNKIPLILRFDVDLDLQTALQLSEFLNKINISASFYILPYAEYSSNYPEFKNQKSKTNENRFKRFANMYKYYKRIQDLGHEVGLHYFPYGVYVDMKMDGAQSIIEDLKYFKKNDINIKSAAGHSSFNKYKLQMQEIFKEYENKSVNKGYTRNLYKGKKSVFFKNISLPRLKISSKSLNLSIYDFYFDNFKRNSKDFCFSFRENCNIIGSDNKNYTLNSVLHKIKSLDFKKTRAMFFLMHPLHLNMRTAESKNVEKKIRKKKNIEARSFFNKYTRIKNSLCLFTRRIDELDVQTINYTNNIGILDYRFSIDVINSSPNKSILFLGGKVFDCPHLQISQQIQGCLRKIISKEFFFIKLSSFTSSISSFEYLLNKIKSIKHFDYIIIHLSAEIKTSTLLNLITKYFNKPTSFIFLCDKDLVVSQNHIRKRVFSKSFFIKLKFTDNDTIEADNHLELSRNLVKYLNV